MPLPQQHRRRVPAASDHLERRPAVAGRALADHGAAPAVDVSEATGKSPRLVITTRQERRPTPRHVRKAIKQLWRSDVKRWCDVQGKHIDSHALIGWDNKEEQELEGKRPASNGDSVGPISREAAASCLNAEGRQGGLKLATHLRGAKAEPRVKLTH